MKLTFAYIICLNWCNFDLSKTLNRRAYNATHVTHLQTMLEKHKFVPYSNLHESNMQTFCIGKQWAIDLNKMVKVVSVEGLQLELLSDQLLCYFVERKITLKTPQRSSAMFMDFCCHLLYEVITKVPISYHPTLFFMQEPNILK